MSARAAARTMVNPRAAACTVGAVDVATGLLLLTQPARVLQTVTHERGALDTVVVRALGARSATQGIALMMAPRQDSLLAAGAIDLLHSATMVALATFRPGYRRAGISSATLSCLTGSLSLAAARRVHP